MAKSPRTKYRYKKSAARMVLFEDHVRRAHMRVLTVGVFYLQGHLDL